MRSQPIQYFSHLFLLHLNLSGPIATPKNLIFFIFHLHFSSFTYKSFSTKIFITSSTILSCSSSSIPTIILSIKLATSPILIKSQRIPFIIIWNVAKELVSPKNITMSSKCSSRVVNTTFYSSLSLICILLWPHHKSSLVNTFLVLIFSTMSEIKDKG